MSIQTTSKPVEHIAVGDVVETEDGFSLTYMTVERIELKGHLGEYWLYGEEDGEDGELYVSAGETVEVVADEDKDAAVALSVDDEDDEDAIDAAIVAEEERIAKLQHDGDSIDSVDDVPRELSVTVIEVTHDREYTVVGVWLSEGQRFAHVFNVDSAEEAESAFERWNNEENDGDEYVVAAVLLGGDIVA